MTVNQHGMLIRNARILTMDPTIGDLERGDLLIEGGRVSALSPGLEADRTEEFDATGNIVLPGFIDSHRHGRRAVTCPGYLETPVLDISRLDTIRSAGFSDSCSSDSN